MGRLLEMAMAAKEEQDRCAKSAKKNCNLPENGNEADLPPRAITIHDIDDINDQSSPDIELPVVSEPIRFLFELEDLEQFACSGKIVRVYLKAIDDTILMVADNAPLADGLFGLGLMTYETSEWEALRGVTPEHFRRIHESKKLFGGKIEP